jgi:uncharacterized repeat protein (TIGR03803 family)
VGSVFEMTPSGTVTVLYSFSGLADGGSPKSPLVQDSEGNLYGATSGGGIFTCLFSEPCGVVFRLDLTGTETVLHTFTGGADGAMPYSSLVRDPGGNLYGTTCAGGASGVGVVFEIDANGTETVLHSFTPGIRTASTRSRP